MANIGFISLGCAKNQVDCERMMYRVQEAGHTVKSDVVGSDVVVINTCGFIDSAKSEAIDTILAAAELKAAGEVGKILVTGCLSQRYQADILEELPEIDGIMGTGCFGDIVTALEQVKLCDALAALLETPQERASRERAPLAEALERDDLTDVTVVLDGPVITPDARWTLPKRTRKAKAE